MSYDTHANAASAPKILNIFLWILSLILGLVAIFLLGAGIIFTVPNGLRESLFSDIAGQGSLPNSENLLAIACFGGATITAAYFYVVRLLNKIVATLLVGEPFAEGNISRLRKIWMFIAATEILRMIISVITSGGEGINLDIRFGAWFLVFVIATLSEVFRHGAELKRDQELTV
ncbi:MAG: DUF2975 domain-containing protein [Maricaulaceae bacterium]